MNSRKLIKSLSLSFCLAIGSVFVLPVGASALSGNDFVAGNIIANNIFFNDSSMSPQQIQAFLNTKVPTCDTYGTQPYTSNQTRAQYAATKGYQPPFTCLKDYAQTTPTMSAESGLCAGLASGNRTASQIIYDVSRSCGVSPKVLLVLLQKEQSLVTDTWPLPNQYAKATGFACPDTAPCDPAYAGFFYQVYNAARQFKKYARDAGNYNYRSGRNNTIRYSPNDNCPSSTVYIQNQATAGLYVYTPYQPNQAALNNLYGSGDACSAYGNRNFWRMFNDWFGSTQFWSLMRTIDSPALYKISGNTKINIPSQDIQEEFGYANQPTSIVPSQTLNSYNLGSPYSTSLGSNLIKTPDDGDKDGGTVYLVTRGVKYTIPSMEVFNAYDFSNWAMTFVPIEIVDEIPGTSNISLFMQAPDTSVYKIESGTRRVIFDISTLNAENPSGVVTPASNYTLSQISAGKPVLSGPALIVYPDSSVDLIVSDKYYRVPSADTLLCWGFAGGTNADISQFRVPSWSNMSRSDDGTLSCTVKSGSDNYLMNGADRVLLPEDVNLSGGVNLPSTIYNRLPVRSQSLLAAIKQPGSAKVWFVDKSKGTKRLIPSINTYLSLGINDSNTSVLTGSAVNAFPEAGYKLADGELVKLPDSPAIYVINGDVKINIPSAELMNSYGFNWGAVGTADPSNLADYPTNSTSLPYIYYDDENIFLVGVGKSYRVPLNLYAHYGLNATTIRQGTRLAPRIYSSISSPQLDASRFVKSQYSDVVYYIESGQKRPLASWDTFLTLSGGNPSAIMALSPEILSSLADGPIKY